MNFEDVMGQIEAFAGDRPILIVEIGRPSGKGAGSSEELQADFIDEIFDVLGRRDSSKFLGAIWLTTHDWPVDPMKEWVHNQFPELDGHEAFLSFLTSNGLLDHKGAPKPSYERWRSRLGAMG